MPSTPALTRPLLLPPLATAATVLLGMDGTGERMGGAEMRMGSRGDVRLEEAEDWLGFLLHALGIDQPHIAHDRCS